MSKVEDSQENFDICMEYCKPCLTFSDIEGEGLFCARGKSSTPREKKDAIAGPVSYNKSLDAMALTTVLTGLVSSLYPFNGGLGEG